MSHTLDSNAKVPNSRLEPVGVSTGGTGITSYAVGDILYADTTTSLAKIAAPTSGQRIGKALGWSTDSILGWIVLALAMRVDVAASAVDVDTGGNSSYGVSVMNIKPTSHAGSDV